MKFSDVKVTTQKEVLKRKLGGELFAPITLADSAFVDGVCKAGSVVDASGAIVNDATAIGITINDATIDNPVVSILKAFGTINTANCPVEITEATKGALKNIIFE